MQSTPSTPHQTESTPFSKFKLVLFMTGVVLVAMIVGDLLSIPFQLLMAETPGLYGDLFFFIATSLSFIGMFLVGYYYLHRTSRGREYIDVQSPTKRTAKYIVLGTVGSIAVFLVGNIVIAFLDIPVSDTILTDLIGSELHMIALFAVIVLFFNAPAEEFLFRNVVQKRLTESFTLWPAILITSVIFALVHLPGYLLIASLVESTIPIVIIFGGSIIFGWVYAKTGNILVPTGAHILYNWSQLAVYAATVL